ncbi:MAG: glucosamine-6-phosphate deaminase [Actinomycetaceae bacterium]|nr:glucosamine-6-phosphate deaminase [Actinomycetaceae bacterium]
MKIGIFSTPSEASAKAAELVIAEFQAGATNFGVATGSTPDLLYQNLRRAHQLGTFTLEGKRAFALDEYIGISKDHPESYRNVLRRALVGDERTGLREADLHTPEGTTADPHQAARDYDRSIAAAGGIDLQILGIGADGHIGFNEPCGDMHSRTHIDALTDQTITDNARFFGGDPGAVPTHCITQGLGTIMEARQILLLAFGANKARAVMEMVEGPMSARWPATVLQNHSNVTVLLDEDAAANLQLRELHQKRWEMQQ